MLYEIGDQVRFAYFPTNGMVSLLSSTREGATVEVAMIGRNGVIGLPILLRTNTSPYQVLVQMASDAYRLRSEVFHSEFRRDGALQEAVLEHLHGLLVQLSQSSACHRFHSTPERLARWLLISRDCVQSDTIDLSQEFFSRMLGIHRKRVSAAALKLQAHGVIRQRHGYIEILNRVRLEDLACECYDIAKRQVGQFEPDASLNLPVTPHRRVSHATHR